MSRRRPRVAVATRNPGKISEYRRMFADMDLEVVSLEQAGVAPGVEPEESGSTFEENAWIKARALREEAGGFALGDDSGLEVEALGGAPGVFSARYAGVDGPGRDQANIRKLLAEMDDVDDRRRTARFVCALVLLGPRGRGVSSRGECPGRIIRLPRGRGGFGYDPIFVPRGYRRTMAELSMAEKNRISHRGCALRALLEKLRQRELLFVDT